MQFRSCAVKAHGHSGEVGTFQIGDGFAGQQWCGAGRHSRMEAMRHCPADQIKNVRALQGIATGQNENGRLQVGDVANQLLRFHGGQFQWVAL